MSKWWLYNVVVYDGLDAYVVKFIMPYKTKEKDAISMVEKMGCDGEILKVDALYPLTLEEIIALKDGNNEEKNIFVRLNKMFFEC